METEKRQGGSEREALNLKSLQPHEPEKRCQQCKYAKKQECCLFSCMDACVKLASKLYGQGKNEVGGLEQ